MVRTLRLGGRMRSHLSEALENLDQGVANEKELRLIRWARKAEWPVLVPRKPKYETNLIDFSVEFDG